MKKFLTLLIILVAVFSACQPKSSQNTNASNVTTDTSIAKVTNPLGAEENNPKPVAIATNPNTRNVPTKPRPASAIDADKKLVEQCAEEVIKYMVINGRDKTIEEINKGKTGAFSAYIPQIHNYFSLNKIINGVLAIVAHSVNAAYIGFEVDSSKFADLTGWLYWQATESKKSESNRIWTTNVYWQDPQWVNNQECKMDNYTRIFKFEGNEYWYFNNLWLTQ